MCTLFLLSFVIGTQLRTQKGRRKRYFSSSTTGCRKELRQTGDVFGWTGSLLSHKYIILILFQLPPWKPLELTLKFPLLNNFLASFKLLIFIYVQTHQFDFNCSLFLFLLFLLWCWGMNPGPCACQATTATELNPQAQQLPLLII